MKEMLKFFILIIAIVIAVFSVLSYANTKVKLPDNDELIDQFKVDLASFEKKIINAKTEDDLDYNYDSAIKRIKIYRQENKIHNNLADQFFKDIVNSYSTLFFNNCDKRIQNTKWSGKDINYIHSRIIELENVKNSQGVLLDIKNKNSLDKINSIVKLYKAALVTSNKTTYESLNATRFIVDDIRGYLSHRDLSNCEDLKIKLNSTINQLAESHYKYVYSKVLQLGKYRSYPYGYYKDKIVYDVDQAIYDYEVNAKLLYSKKKDLSALIKLGEKYISEAKINEKYKNGFSKK